MRRSHLLVAATVLGSGLARAQSLPAWELSQAPVLTIGAGGAPKTEFARLSDAFRLPNGHVVVANGNPLEMRIFDERGKFLRTFGRQGSGPGEFQQFSWIGLFGDTAIIHDLRERRITTVVLTAAQPKPVTKPITSTSDRGTFAITGRLPDGRFVAYTLASPRFDGPPGVSRLPWSGGLVPATLDGKVDWFAKLDGMAQFVHNPTGNIKEALVGPTAFSPWSYVATSGNAVWFGDGAADSLTRLSADGTRRTIRLPLARRRPSPAMIASERDQELALARNDRSRAFTNAKYGAELLPRQLPVFQSIQPGHAGEVWVHEFTSPRTAPSRYIVINAAGIPVAQVNVPAGVRLSDLGRDFVVGVHTDDDGVETVRVYRLTRR